MAALPVFLAGGAIAAQPATPPVAVTSDREEISSLAQNLDAAIKFCGEQIVRAAMRDTNVGRVETEAAQRRLVEFLDNPPAPLAAMARPQYGPARFARWFDPHTTILIVSYQQTPACRIVVTNSEWAHRAVSDLQRLVQVGNFWQPHETADPVPEHLIRSVFAAQTRPESATQPMLTITMPREAPEQTSVQLTIGVSLVNRTER